MKPELYPVLFAVLAILHFTADFLLQPHEMAKKKSEDPKVLARHVYRHLMTFFIGLVFLVGVEAAVLISTINAVLHAAIDWNVWRGYKRYAIKKAMVMANGTPPMPYDPYSDHKFWVTLGVDQLLHALSIALAVYLVLVLKVLG